jgi:imidazolonepropionase-like amidohydrolase
VLVRAVRLAALVWTLVASTALGQVARPGSAPPVVIANATVLTVTRGVIEHGSILIRDGRIVAVGTTVDVPAGATVIDGTGLHVMPGIVDAHSHIAIDGALNESSLSVTSMVSTADVLNPADINIYRGLAGGVTTANILHGSANAIGGTNAVIKLRWGADARGLLFAGAPSGIKFALGENPKRSNMRSPTGLARYPATRMGVMDVIREALVEARAYQARLRQYDDAVAAGDTNARPPARDLALEPLVEVLDGTRLVHAHCYRADEILQLLRLAEEFGFRIATLQHALEGYKVADEIAAHGAGASTFSDWWGYKVEAQDAIPHNAALMAERGVLVSINSDSAEEQRHLNQEAAKAVRYGGMSEEQALRLVTINPALQLGIADRVGSIDVGKDADLVLYDGHPLSVYAVARMVLIDGQVYFARDREREPPVSAASRAAAASPALPPIPAPSDLLAITGARIVTVSGPTIDSGTVVMQDGRILSVGASVTIPEGATIIDGRGLEVHPGFFDAMSQLGLTEVGSVNATNDISETGAHNPQLVAATAVHPASDHLPVARSNGITHAVAAPGVPSTALGAGPVIGGQASAIHLDGWTIEDMLIDPSVGMVVNWPSTQGTSFDVATFSRRARSYTEAREDQARQLRELTRWITEARAYRASRRQAPDTVGRDLKLEALGPYVSGERAWLVNANRAGDIREAVAYFVGTHGLRMVLVGAREAWKVAALLADQAVPVILGPTQSLPTHEDDPYDAPMAAPAVLQAAGVRVALSTYSSADARNLPFEAGTAVAFGLPRDAAIRAITLEPAWMLGLDALVGSIEPGKLANLIVTAGDPLEIRSEVRLVVIRGVPVPLDTRHTRLYETYRARPRPATR